MNDPQQNINFTLEGWRNVFLPYNLRALLYPYASLRFGEDRGSRHVPYGDLIMMQSFVEHYIREVYDNRDEEPYYFLRRVYRDMDEIQSKFFKDDEPYLLLYHFDYKSNLAKNVLTNDDHGNICYKDTLQDLGLSFENLPKETADQVVTFLKGLPEEGTDRLRLITSPADIPQKIALMADPAHEGQFIVQYNYLDLRRATIMALTLKDLFLTHPSYRHIF